MIEAGSRCLASSTKKSAHMCTHDLRSGTEGQTGTPLAAQKAAPWQLIYKRKSGLFGFFFYVQRACVPAKRDGRYAKYKGERKR